MSIRLTPQRFVTINRVLHAIVYYYFVANLLQGIAPAFSVFQEKYFVGLFKFYKVIWWIYLFKKCVIICYGKNVNFPKLQT